MPDPRDLLNPRLNGPAASNALIAPPTTTFEEYPGLDRGSLPVGGTNTASMLAGGMKKASAYISANRNNIGYALGKAAQAVMGPRQDTPAAQLGGLGAQLNQQQAFKSTTAKMLAGTDLADIPEASILAPEQIGEIATQARAVEALKFDKAKHASELKLKEEELRLKGVETGARVKESEAQVGLMGQQGKEIEARLKTYVSPIVLKYMDQSFDWAKLNQEHLNKLKELDKEGAIRTKVAEIGAGGNEAAARAFVSVLGQNIQAGVENPLAESVTAYNTGAGAFGWKQIEVPKAAASATAAPVKTITESEYYGKDKGTKKSPWDKIPGGTEYTTTAGVGAPPVTVKTPEGGEYTHPIYGKRLNEGYGKSKDKPLFIRNAEDLTDAPDGLWVTGPTGVVGVVRGGKVYAE